MVTVIWATLLATVEHGIKRLFALSSTIQLGFMIYALGNTDWLYSDSYHLYSVAYIFIAIT